MQIGVGVGVGIVVGAAAEAEVASNFAAQAPDHVEVEVSAEVSGLGTRNPYVLRGGEAGGAGARIEVGVRAEIVVEAAAAGLGFEAEVASNFAAQARDNIEGEARAAFAC